MHVDLEPPTDAENWEQESDVLDTWFSSWLWPFATMDQATKQKFYPTQDLVTGPDIIFFWVARMIMAGLEYEGKIPFENVFFTGIIRDLEGRKMSKSLGNSPDPLDLIARYGADGLRFGLMRIAPHGQDIRFDEKQIEEGRNFANKLWNAFRFRQLHGPLTDGEPTEPLSPYSTLILQRLHETVDRVGAGYRDYLFTDIGQALYDFVWSDLCDWYLEAIKIELQGADRVQSLRVMDRVLSAVLRLLHPMMPHLTEELWQRMGFGDGTIQFAALDQLKVTLPLETDRIEFARQVYEAVSLTRNLRAQYRIASNRRARIILKPNVSGDFAVFAKLVNADPLEVDPAYEAEQGIPVVVSPLGQVFLPLEGLFDLDAERERLQKEIARLEADLETVRQKLGNENFVNRAPAAVVEEHRRRERDFLEKLEQLRKRL
jgi:valyl-tRNA synthetase